jgi:hypothetical protein
MNVSDLNPIADRTNRDGSEIRTADPIVTSAVPKDMRMKRNAEILNLESDPSVQSENKNSDGLGLRDSVDGAGHSDHGNDRLEACSGREGSSIDRSPIRSDAAAVGARQVFGGRRSAHHPRVLRPSVLLQGRDRTPHTPPTSCSCFRGRRPGSLWGERLLPSAPRLDRRKTSAESPRRCEATA